MSGSFELGNEVRVDGELCLIKSASYGIDGELHSMVLEMPDRMGLVAVRVVSPAPTDSDPGDEQGGV